jgi:hypothetical protein
LTFEPGSQLRKTERRASEDCAFLKSISLEEVFIDEANPHYFVSGDFVIGFERMTLIRRLGNVANVIVGRECEIIDCTCFAARTVLSPVAFEDGTKLTRIEEFALAASSLRSNCIPLGLKFLPSRVFSAIPPCLSSL